MGVALVNPSSYSVAQVTIVFYDRNGGEIGRDRFFERWNVQRIACDEVIDDLIDSSIQQAFGLMSAPVLSGVFPDNGLQHHAGRLLGEDVFPPGRGRYYSALDRSSGHIPIGAGTPILADIGSYARLRCRCSLDWQ
jgi:hypothetical protein